MAVISQIRVVEMPELLEAIGNVLAELQAIRTLLEAQSPASMEALVAEAVAIRGRLNEPIAVDLNDVSALPPISETDPLAVKVM